MAAVARVICAAPEATGFSIASPPNRPFEFFISGRGLKGAAERATALAMSANGPKRTSASAPHMSAFEGEADIAPG